MRLLLVFALLLDVPSEAAFVLGTVLGCCCCLAAFHLGVWVSAKGMDYQFNQHIDGHALSVAPIPGCRFCRIERGLR